MGRWIRILLGPLPATLVLLPFLIVGGVGTVLATLVGLGARGRTLDESWRELAGTLPILLWVAAGVVGLLALWIAVLAESPATLRAAPFRWWLAAGLLVGVVAAGLWLWPVMTTAPGYGPATWAVWIALLAGPIVLGIYYLRALLRR